jgi:hypothetical protein
MATREIGYYYCKSVEEITLPAGLFAQQAIEDVLGRLWRASLISARQHHFHSSVLHAPFASFPNLGGLKFHRLASNWLSHTSWSTIRECERPPIQGTGGRNTIKMYLNAPFYHFPVLSAMRFLG